MQVRRVAVVEVCKVLQGRSFEICSVFGREYEERTLVVGVYRIVSWVAVVVR